MHCKKTIAVLGATGSVGSQSLDVAYRRGMKVSLLTASTNVKQTELLARKFRPLAVAMADETAAGALRVSLADMDMRIYSGARGICDAIYDTHADVYVNSILGCAGLLPTLAVIEKGARLALANKESLVVAGEEVMRRAKACGAEILPVDSEHCAIFQCLKSGRAEEVKNIILTASGGPFYGYTSDMLKDVTLEDTLRHPTWSMGGKITVDSATLMNKGFEVIEAVRLFGVSPDNIRVVVHRESIIHSAVEYIDNNIIAQMSVPDMRSCVQYAIDYPERKNAQILPLDLFSVGKLSFLPPDTSAFPLLDAAFVALRRGGCAPAVLNAADEVAVGAFLDRKLPFFRISEAVMKVCDTVSGGDNVSDIAGILDADAEARVRAGEIVDRMRA